MLEIGQKVTKMDQEDCLPANAEEIQEGPAQIDVENASEQCRLSLPRASNVGLRADE